MSTLDQTNFVDTRGAAAIIGLSASTLATLRVRGGSPPFRKHGRRVFYSVADLLAWSQERLCTSTSQNGVSTDLRCGFSKG